MISVHRRSTSYPQISFRRKSSSFASAVSSTSTARAATSGEVKDLRRETAALKEVVADLTLENRLLDLLGCQAASHD